MKAMTTAARILISPPTSIMGAAIIPNIRAPMPLISKRYQRAILDADGHTEDTYDNDGQVLLWGTG